LVAAVLGWFIFSSRITGIYFSLITMALVEIFELLIQAGQQLTGGSNGIGGVPKLYFGSGTCLTLTSMYYFVLVCMVIAYVLCRFITNSKFGKITKAIKNNEARVDFLGYDSARYKLILFVISGMLAGFAGALYAPMNGMISTSDVGLTFSTTMIIWLAIGGRGNLTGAAVGCLLVNLGKSFLSERFTDSWQFILGVILVLVVFFMPEGIVGKVMKISSKNRKEKRVYGRSSKA
jgi:urea transport system permease protein